MDHEWGCSLIRAATRIDGEKIKLIGCHYLFLWFYYIVYNLAIIVNHVSRYTSILNTSTYIPILYPYIQSLPPKIFAIPFATWLSQDSMGQKYSKARYGKNSPYPHNRTLLSVDCIIANVSLQPQATQQNWHKISNNHIPNAFHDGATCGTARVILLLPIEVPSDSRHIHLLSKGCWWTPGRGHWSGVAGKSWCPQDIAHSSFCDTGFSA